MIEIPERVKDSLRDGRLLKNYRFNVLKDDGTIDFVIDNPFLVSESVKYDERMSSGTDLKFGLCEGSSLEFQYFNKPNINGRQLQTFVDVQYYPVEEKAATLTETNTTYTVTQPGDFTLVIPANTAFTLTLTHNGQTTQDEYFPVGSESTINLKNYKAGDVIKTTTDYEGYTFSIDLMFTSNGWHTIPMGFFTVSQCPMQFSTGIRKAVCYNKLKSEYLDQKANLLALESFSTRDTNLLIYDLQNILLDDFQIKHELQPLVPVGEYPGVTGSGPLNSLPLYFTQNYGLRAEISGYAYWDYTGNVPTSSSVIYIYLQCQSYEYNVSGATTYWELRENFGALATFEQTVLARFKEIFDNAKLRTTVTTPPMTGGVVTGQMMADYVCKVKGFQYLFGIRMIKGGVTTWYSTVQWDYEERNNITHTVAGTIDDFVKVTHDGTAQINVFFPYEVDALQSQYSSGTPQAFIRIPFGEYKSYRYWPYEDIPDITNSFPVDAIQYADGTEYSNDGDESNIKDALTIGTVQLSDADKIRVNIDNIPEFTLRNIISASYETVCQFGKLDRITDLFSGVELNTEALFPREDLYPENTLYPSGGMDKTVKSSYSKLWTDTVGTQTFRNLIITYKGLDENNQEKEFTLQRTVNANGTTDYNMSDNWLFKNLIWTASQVGDYADAMVAKMRGIEWFPFELWGAGLPWLETGDEIEIVTPQGSYTSYVLQRQLNGIQNLQDTFINGELDIF